MGGGRYSELDPKTTKSGFYLGQVAATEQAHVSEQGVEIVKISPLFEETGPKRP